VRIDVKQKGSSVVFDRFLEPEDERYTPPGRGRIGNQSVQTDLYGSLEDVHPDLVALGCLLSSELFAAHSINLNFAVSESFASTVSAVLGKALGPTTPSIQPRAAPPLGNPGLAFSGGIDSCAALLLLPDNTVAVFMDRITPAGSTRGLYRNDAALASCRAVAKSGRRMEILGSSVEHGRQPVGYPVDWANGIPAVLNADYLALNCLAFGTVLESVYRIGD